jgi:hypothetical protein
MGFPGYSELAKHIRYKRFYKENDLFWGLGIEEETYLQFTKPIYVAAPIIRTCHAAERYSVRYYTTYKPTYKLAFQALFTDTSGSSGSSGSGPSGFYPLPYFFNAHSFTKMDTNGQHPTTYEKVPKTNSKFSGKTFFQQLEENTPGCFKKKFIDIFNKNCIFDGDTLEFMTQDFFKAKVKHVVNELIQSKKELLNSINEFLIKNKLHRDKGLLMYPPVNPGFAIFYTNPKNVTMFNNGTYHINITLPTLLGKRDKNGIPQIIDLENFRYTHQKFIRFIQWLEPFVIAVFGTKDPLSEVNDKYSKASQRCAVSRYIGIGTYDTKEMPAGKIVTVPVKEIRGSQTDFWWYKIYHANSGYIPLTELGMDISYRKHYNHGVEIRFLDWFPEDRLKGLIEFYLCLADASLQGEMPAEPVMSKAWNEFLVSVLKEGSTAIVSADMIIALSKIFGEWCLTDFPPPQTVKGVYERLSRNLDRMFKDGMCNKLMR